MSYRTRIRSSLEGKRALNDSTQWSVSMSSVPNMYRTGKRLVLQIGERGGGRRREGGREGGREREGDNKYTLSPLISSPSH